MLKYAFKRVLLLIPVLIGVSAIVFTLLYLTPGDPAETVLGNSATPEAIAEFRQKEGLDDPFAVQFARYIYKAAIHGDIGRSYITKRPVAQEIFMAFGNTLKLASCALVIAISMGIFFGVISAIYQYSLLDSCITILAMLGLSMPVFWLGMLLILGFAIHLRWLPSSGFNTFSAMILPSFALATNSLAVITRMTRSSMLEVIRADYIRTARAKGQKERVIVVDHCLKNALIPIITTCGLQFGMMLGGAVLSETIFSIPGVGRLMVDGIKMRDYPVVQGGVLIIAVCYCIINLVVDLMYTFVDPRIKEDVC